ncbi:hypothetical protein [Arenicella xantha]|uniref:Uncharacterized protein n=1 Tax=Arenicella xantha TaxID=644221 RepID=A0A395JT76_9GAMM|nr:hypothetical protein [Arenicella xantha]RBP53542.1 hypothetical protein DFR28_101929 [Arenicella xantha]
MKLTILASLLLAITVKPCFAEDPLDLPLISISHIENNFVGAFKVDYQNAMTSYDERLSTGYANGRIAYNKSTQTVFIDSHVYTDATGEFKIPNTLGQSGNPDNLPNATAVQDFTPLLPRASTANSQGMDSFGGMAVIGSELYLQVYDYYDAPATDTNTTLVVRNHNDLANSEVNGFFDLAGAGKTLSYISPIPRQWQSLLQGKYLAGNGGGVPINARVSIGPSLFAFNPADFGGKTSGNIQSKEWLSYSLSKPLSTSPGNWDGYNESLNNKLWTHNSGAWFGFIAAGTRTFVVLGGSAMHNSGGGYKITQTNGRLCGGPCPRDPHDASPYYWLYDVKDILSSSPSKTLLPYEYGEFDSRYVQYGEQGITGAVSGGAYDPDTGKLFLLLKSATANSNAGSPVVSVYQLPAQKKTNTTVPVLQLLLDE